MLIKKDFSLKPYNTFGLDVFAHRLAIIPSLVELRNLYNNGELTKSKVLILSQGSNILFKAK
jgi:UDP-N-acetylmuramate dehydrogenase